MYFVLTVFTLMTDKRELMMSAKALIFLTLFSASFAYAHPNHMNFEDVLHNETGVNIPASTAHVFHHDTKTEKQGHSSDIPCTEQQHIKTPCKEK